MPKAILFENDNGEEVELPTVNEVCGTCQGDGTTVFGWDSENAAVFTSEDFNEDPDLMDNLAEGVYDKPCPECKGNKVVAVVDEAALENKDPNLFKQWTAAQESIRRMRAEERSERRFGA